MKEKVVDLLPKLYDQRVVGEATIQQVFQYTVKGAGQRSVAGCRVGNGAMSKKAKVKVVRDGEVMFEGKMLFFVCVLVGIATDSRFAMLTAMQAIWHH